MDRRYVFTSESVSMGHPDKMCDQISDAVLDKMLEHDPHSRVACECLATTGLVVVAGEITSQGFDKVRIADLTRDVIEEIGYTDETYGLSARSCGVVVALDKQSPDIALGVDEDDQINKELGAGDQGIMFGYANSDTPEYMPLPIRLAHQIVERLTHLRRHDDHFRYLRPDAKSQVTVEYEGDKPIRVDTVVCSTQHAGDVSLTKVKDDVTEQVIFDVIPDEFLDKDKLKIHVNPTGRFVIGGPHGDTGLTGRKVIVDTYGGMGRHGGGAFSGKDATKVDRSASYMARYIAKNIVAAGLAGKCEVQLSYAIGVANPTSVLVKTYGTAAKGVNEEQISTWVQELFRLTPTGIIDSLYLRRPIYRKTSYHGHFGRELPEFTWEKLDKVDDLRKLAGI